MKVDPRRKQLKVVSVGLWGADDKDCLERGKELLLYIISTPETVYF